MRPRAWSAARTLLHARPSRIARSAPRGTVGFATAIAAAGALLLAACGGGPSGPGAQQPHKTLHAAAPTLDGRVGEFVVQSGDEVFDVLGAGGLVEVIFERDHTIVGRIFVPAGIVGVGEVDVEFQGTWRIEGGALRIAPDVPTLLEDLAFQVDGPRVAASGVVNGRAVSLELASVARTDPTLVDPGFTPFEYSSGRVIVPKKGLRIFVVGVDETGTDQAVLLGPCAVFGRAYPAGEESLIWDQSIEDADCGGPRRLALVEAGGEFRVETPLITIGDVLDFGALPDGTYDLWGVLRLGAREAEVFAVRVTMSYTD